MKELLYLFKIRHLWPKQDISLGFSRLYVFLGAVGANRWILAAPDSTSRVSLDAAYRNVANAFESHGPRQRSKGDWYNAPRLTNSSKADGTAPASFDQPADPRDPEVFNRRYGAEREKPAERPTQ